MAQAETVEEQRIAAHVPMTGFTRPVSQGTTWRDCEERGMVHDWVGSKTTEVAVYLRCSRCPVVTRKQRITKADV